MNFKKIKTLSPMLAILLFTVFSVTWTLVDEFSLTGLVVSALVSLIVTNIVVYIAKMKHNRRLERGDCHSEAPSG